MSNDLRAHLKELCALHVQGDSLEPLMADILPVVEQAIQQEQEKAEYFLRRASEQHERDAAALADHNTRIDKLDAIRLRWEVLTTSTPWLIAALGYARAYTAFNSDRTVDADPADMIRWLLNRSDLYGNAAESALAEKDAQIAALQVKIDDAEGPWWASELAAENYELNVQIAALTKALQDVEPIVYAALAEHIERKSLRETPAPPEETP